MIPPLPSDIFRIGQVVNNTFEVLGVLGRGGTGEVYRALHRFNEREFALKVLSAQFAQNQDALALMRREEEMREIRHDAVVRYSESFFTAEGHVVLVMDFIDGKPLSDMMAARPLQPMELLVIARRIAQGLVVTHGHGVVHRDLSPDNIILRGNNPEEAVIIDFGIAKDTSIGATTIVGNEFAGKYEYAAPEQISGNSGPASDLYALGATLLAAFNGAPPVFSGIGEIAEAKRAPLPTGHVPAPLRDLIDWLTVPQVAGRAPSAAAVEAHLAALLAPPPDPGRRWFQKRPPLWLWTPVAGLMAVAMLWMGLTAVGLLPGPRALIEGEAAVADPYRLRAGWDGDRGTLSGFGPSTAEIRRLRAAVTEATGAAPTGRLTRAAGVPSASWAGDVAALIAGLSLERWSLEVEGGTAVIDGLAADVRARDAVLAHLSALSERSGLSISAAIAAGPETLNPADVTALLAEAADCGPLSFSQARGGALPLGAPLDIQGPISGPAAEGALRQRLALAMGDRALRMTLTPFNPSICAVRAALPPVGPGALEVVLSDGESGAVNETGIFRTEDNPVAELLLPATPDNGSLWSMIVATDGSVYHILPHRLRPIHAVNALGVVEGGVRRVRLLHTIAEYLASNTRNFAVEIDSKNYGLQELHVIWSDRPLFPSASAAPTTPEGVAEALAALRADGSLNVFAIASRILETRP